MRKKVRLRQPWQWRATVFLTSALSETPTIVDTERLTRFSQ